MQVLQTADPQAVWSSALPDPVLADKLAKSFPVSWSGESRSGEAATIFQQLTQRGVEGSLRTGSTLRRRYVDETQLLPKEVDTALVHVRATNAPRTVCGVADWRECWCTCFGLIAKTKWFWGALQTRQFVSRYFFLSDTHRCTGVYLYPI